MTPKQLAQHWQISESEAEDISNFINKFYQLDVIPVVEKSKTFWKGVMYAYDPHNKYILRESEKKFVNPDHAIVYWTDKMHNHKISDGQAKQMRSGQGVPTNVYLALKPVKGYERIVQKERSLNTLLNRLSKER